MRPVIQPQETEMEHIAPESESAITPEQVLSLDTDALYKLLNHELCLANSMEDKLQAMEKVLLDPTFVNNLTDANFIKIYEKMQKRKDASSHFVLRLLDLGHKMKLTKDGEPKSQRPPRISPETKAAVNILRATALKKIHEQRGNRELESSGGR